MEELFARLRKLERVDTEVCHCCLGAHVERVVSSDGEFVRWDDLEALLTEFTAQRVED